MRDRLLLDWGLRSTLGAAAAVLTGSECTRDLQQLYGIPPERITVTPSLLPGFTAQVRPGWPLSGRNILSGPSCSSSACGNRGKTCPRHPRLPGGATHPASPHRLAIVGSPGGARTDRRPLPRPRSPWSRSDMCPTTTCPRSTPAPAFLFPRSTRASGSPCSRPSPAAPGHHLRGRCAAGGCGRRGLLWIDRGGSDRGRYLQVLSDAQLRARLIAAGHERLGRFDWRAPPKRP